MALNTSEKDIIARRRQRVAELRLRGFTQRGIAQRLTEEGIVNFETRKPYSLGTINSDLQALDLQWREEARQDIATHKARLLAESREVRRAAWEQGELRVVQRGIDQEMSILGTRGAAPNSGGRGVIGASEDATSSRAASSGKGLDVESAGAKRLSGLTRLLPEALQKASPAQRSALVDDYDALRSLAEKIERQLHNILSAPDEAAPAQEPEALEEVSGNGR